MVKQSESVGHSELVGGGETTKHSHPGGGGGATFVVSGVQAFSGDSPTGWSELDLSGIIGANPALVMLRLHAGSDMDATSVRTLGDTVEYYSSAADASAQGMALAHHDSTNAIVLMVLTDGTGKIEWRTEKSVGDATVVVMAYIK